VYALWRLAIAMPSSWRSRRTSVSNAPKTASIPKNTRRRHDGDPSRLDNAHQGMLMVLACVQCNSSGKSSSSAMPLRFPAAVGRADIAALPILI
jgi:hypothetical protein